MNYRELDELTPEDIKFQKETENLNRMELDQYLGELK